MLKTQWLIRPPGNEFPELDVAVSGGVGHLEVEQAFGARDVAVEDLQQDVEFILIDEAIAVDVAQIEDPA